MKRKLIVHPLLLAVFPVLFIFAANVQAFGIEVTLRPAAKALFWTAAGWAALSLAFRNARKAAIVTSLFVVLYYSYGHVVDALGDFASSVGGARIHTPQFVMAGGIAVFVAGAYFTMRTKSDLVNLTKVLNFAAACLVAFPVVRILAYEAGSAHRGRREAPAAPHVVAVPAPSRPPSIFYIILDGYGRADNLKEIYGYDNQPFIDFLRSKGFYVADRARTNYSHTRNSLASSLNMEYLDGLAAWVGGDTEDARPVEALIRHSKVRSMVESLGYKVMAFATGLYATEIEDADSYLKDPALASEFERGLSNTTPILSGRGKAELDRKRILFTLNELPALAASGKPVFVFAHIIAPHPPYVFARDGGPSDIARYYGLNSGNHLVNRNGITRSESMRRYIDQMVFLNSMVEKAVNGVLAASKTPPVIILQGDHGPCCFLHHTSLEKTYLQDRMSMLNAYYLPGGAGGELYDTITPVNSFRVVFNHCFGTGYSMLPDRSFYSSVKTPYRFIDVTDQIGSEADRKRYEELRGQEYYDVPAQAELPAGVKAP